MIRSVKLWRFTWESDKLLEVAWSNQEEAEKRTQLASRTQAEDTTAVEELVVVALAAEE